MSMNEKFKKKQCGIMAQNDAQKCRVWQAYGAAGRCASVNPFGTDSGGDPNQVDEPTAVNLLWKGSRFFLYATRDPKK